jgi:hypothetical protein
MILERCNAQNKLMPECSQSSRGLVAQLELQVDEYVEKLTRKLAIIHPAPIVERIARTSITMFRM